MFKVADQNSSIYVELTAKGAARTQEFPPAQERALVVGSTERADLQVSGIGVAPVQFHLEREDGALLLIPAYGIADLSVNAIPVLGPTPLAERSVIEFCGVRVYAALREADALSTNDDRFAAQGANSQAGRESYSLRLPGEEDSTVLAMRPIRAAGEPIAANLENALLENTTQRLPPFRAVPALAQDDRPVLTSDGTEIMAPYRPHASAASTPQPSVPPEIDRAPASLRPTPELASPLNNAHQRGSRAAVVHRVPPRTQDASANRASSGHDGPQSRDATVAAPSRRPRSLARSATILSKLGLLTRARPFLVIGAASVGALILVLVLLAAARSIDRHQFSPAVKLARGAVTAAVSTVPPDAKHR